MNGKVKGYLLSIGSAVIFGVSASVMLLVFNGGGNAINSQFYRCLLVLPVLGAMLLKLPKGQRMPTKKEHKQIPILALSYGIMMITLIGAYTYVGTGVSTVLHYCYPVFTLIFCTLIFRDRFSPFTALCMLATLAGVFLCYQPGQIGSAFGTAIAVFSGICYAWYLTYMSKSGLADMHPAKLMFWLHLECLAVVTIFMLATGTFVIQMTFGAWMAQIGEAFGLLAATLMIQVGIRYIGPQRAAILSTFEPLTAVLIGIFIVGEPASAATVIGIALILAAVVAVTMKKN